MQCKDLVLLPEKELDTVVNAGLFKDKDEAVREAVTTFFAVKPKMRLEAAIQLYKENEVTLGRAAKIAVIVQPRRPKDTKKRTVW